MMILIKTRVGDVLETSRMLRMTKGWSYYK